MSQMIVGSFLSASLGLAYRTLADAVNASKPGDTILIKKPVTINDSIRIDHDLIINGNQKDITIEDGRVGFKVSRGDVVISNVNLIVGNRCNAIDVNPNQVNLALKNINIKHRNMLPLKLFPDNQNTVNGYRYYSSEPLHSGFSPDISVSKSSVVESEFNLSISNCWIDYINVNHVEQLTIDQDSVIGNIAFPQSKIAAHQININASQLTNLKLTNYQPGVKSELHNITTIGKLIIHSSLNLDGFSVLPLPCYISRSEWNFLLERMNHNSTKGYALTISSDPDNSQVNIVDIYNVNFDKNSLIYQLDVYSTSAWFNFFNSDITFHDTNLPEPIGKFNKTLECNINLQNSDIGKQWRHQRYVAISDNGQKHLSLISAINHANAGETISLLDNVTLNQTIPLEHNININGNGHSIEIIGDVKGFELIEGEVEFRNLKIDLDDNSFFINKVGKKALNLTLKDLDVSHKNVSTNLKSSIISEDYNDLYHLYDFNFNYPNNPHFNVNIYNSNVDCININYIYNINVYDSVLGAQYAEQSELTAYRIKAMDSQLNNIKLISKDLSDLICFTNISTTGAIEASGDIEINGLTVEPITKLDHQMMAKMESLNKTYTLLTYGTGDDGGFNTKIDWFKVDDQVLADDMKLCRDAAWFNFSSSKVKITNSQIPSTSSVPNLSTSSTVNYGNECVDNSSWRVFKDYDSKKPIVVDNQDHPETPQNIGSLLGFNYELNGLIGLSFAKQQLKKFVDVARLNQIRAKRGMQSDALTMNMVFEGNPGTGKTVVARLFAKALHENGVLKTDKLVEVKAKDLVASYVGQTAKVTAKIIKKSLDGVLFIDEAYSLAPPKNGEGSFNDEVVNELIADMENNRNRLVVIMAGYQSEMKAFFDKSNPGLASRFPNHIQFPDYNETELLQIFDLQLARRFKDANGDYIAQQCTPAARLVVKDAIEKLYQADQIHDNARFIRDQIISKIAEANSERIAEELSINGDVSDSELNTFNEADVKNAMGALLTSLGVHNHYQTGDQNQQPLSAVDQLNALIGLTAVKKEATQLINLAKLNEIKKANHLPVQSTMMNMVFEGSPGTGKTVVARLLAKALFENGVLKTDKLVEVKAEDLVGQYVGQSAPKTAEVVKSALNGVLFIDEAYQIAPEDGNDYNDEVITELLTDIENYRDKLVVIIAGYPKQMEAFLNDSNPGIASRFPNRIIFADYSADELFEILKYTIHDKGISCTDEALTRLHSGINDYIAHQNAGGNGRFIRNLVEKMIRYQADRLQTTLLQLGTNNQLSDNQKEEMMTLNADDAKNALADLIVMD